MSSIPKHITYADAIAKARHYCAYQERCHYEVEEKLKAWGLHYEFIPTVCSELISEGYLNEERFVLAFVTGKFNQSNWGKLKIIQALKGKRIGEILINIGLQEIDDDLYEEKLVSLVEKKKATVKYKTELDLKSKLYRYAIGKGYESQLVHAAINSALKAD